MNKSIKNFKFWLYELDEREIVNARPEIVKSVTSLVQREVKRIKEERDIYCQELELGVSVDCQKHCEKAKAEERERINIRWEEMSHSERQHINPTSL